MGDRRGRRGRAARRVPGACAWRGPASRLRASQPPATRDRRRARRGGWRPDFEVADRPHRRDHARRCRARRGPCDARGRRRRGLGLARPTSGRMRVRRAGAEVGTVQRRLSVTPGPRATVTELWVLRGTRRNREPPPRVRVDLRYPLPGRQPDVAARRLRTNERLAPTTAGLLWTDVRGDGSLTTRLAHRRDGPTD